MFFDKVFSVNVNDLNESPVVNQTLNAQTANQYQPFNFTLPNNSFSDPDAGDHLTLTATLANGSALPSWLSFSSLTGTFNGTPGINDTNPLTIKVVATDTHGLYAENSFNLSINPQSNTPPILSLGQRNNDAAYAVAALNTGNILVAGYSQTAASSDFILLRYTNNGQLDPQFSGDGKTTTSFGELDDISRALALQANGKIIVVGSSDNGHDSDFALARYHSNGRLDTSFGTGGKVTSSLGTGDDDAYAVSVLASGKIIVAGTSDNGNNSDFALIRYNADGSLDTSFSNDGKVSTDFGGSEDNANAMQVQTDGKILVSGTSHGLGSIRFALARYNSDGSLDTSFNGTGKLTTSLAPFDDRAYALSLQEDGKIFNRWRKLEW
ncbi:putative Ig domain-containing protein [Methylocucumis oryzae]|uniref:putative Ig domain-containing protein n=1 Tax=Methylocucumis oryzae TaxID=1632867 RepID=UPI001EF9F5B2|nr:putative Ig domain-containing protein [Methylocucumis oryzae]